MHISSARRFFSPQQGTLMKKKLHTAQQAKLN